MTPPRPKAIDCWLNPAFRAHDYKPDFLVRVAREYFHREKEMFEVTPLEELLRQMDAAGVERAILTIDPHDPAPYVEVRKAFPDRFILSAMLDPMAGMATIRVLENVVTKHDVRLARVTPFLVNRPPNDKVYYPIYAKGIELGVPISVNTGIPGPPMPAIGSSMAERMKRSGNAFRTSTYGAGSCGSMVRIARSTPAASIWRSSSSSGVTSNISFSRWKYSRATRTRKSGL